MSMLQLSSAPRFKLNATSTPPPMLGKRIQRTPGVFNPNGAFNFDKSDQMGTTIVNSKIHTGIKVAPFSTTALNNSLIPGTIAFASSYRPNNNGYVSEETIIPLQVINNSNIEVTFLDAVSKINTLSESLTQSYIRQSKFSVFQSGSKDAVQDYYNKFRYLGIIVSLLQEPPQSRRNTISRDIVVSVAGHCSQAKNIFKATLPYSNISASDLNSGDNLWIIGKNIQSSRTDTVDVNGQTRLGFIPNIWVFTLYGINTSKSPITHSFIEDVPSSYRPAWDVSRSATDEALIANCNSIRSNLNMNRGLESGVCVKKSFRRNTKGHYELQTSNENFKTELNYKFNSINRAVVHKVGRVLFDKGASVFSVENRLFDKPICDSSAEFELIGRI